MKTDSLSEGGKEKQCAPGERGKESILHCTEIERISVLREVKELFASSSSVELGRIFLSDVFKPLVSGQLCMLYPVRNISDIQQLSLR